MQVVPENVDKFGKEAGLVFIPLQCEYSLP
jgi:hypothetical protein